jgi:hypothetical protein
MRQLQEDPLLPFSSPDEECSLELNSADSDVLRAKVLGVLEQRTHSLSGVFTWESYISECDKNNPPPSPNDWCGVEL